MAARKSRRTGRLPAAEAAQIPDRLLDAATALFARVGYTRTTMEAIAREARASSKTVYSRFANKEEVLAAVVRRLMDSAIAAGGGEIGGRTDRENPRTFLLRMGRELAALSEARETVGLNRLIMAEAFQFPELARLFIDLHEQACAAVRDPLVAWAGEGKLPDLPDPRAAAMIFVEMAASLPRIRALLGQPLAAKESDTLVTIAVDLFLRGCGYRGGA
jgi:AcrR family transcriptional regulator